MKMRILILASFLAVVVGAGALQGGEVPRTYVENVSTFICPAKNRDMSGSIHFADKSAKSAVIDGKNRTLKKVRVAKSRWGKGLASSRGIRQHHWSLLLSGRTGSPSLNAAHLRGSFGLLVAQAT
jgi:hypothetical protein